MCRGSPFAVLRYGRQHRMACYSYGPIRLAVRNVHMMRSSPLLCYFACVLGGCVECLLRTIEVLDQRRSVLNFQSHCCYFRLYRSCPFIIPPLRKQPRRHLADEGVFSCHWRPPSSRE